MNWEVVKVSDATKTRTTPCASVGFGRLYFNTAACELLENYNLYTNVELLKGRIGGKLCVGVRFLKESEKTKNSLFIKKRKIKNKLVGATINNKQAMEELFGLNGAAEKTIKYDVKKDQEDPRVLILFND